MVELLSLAMAAPEEKAIAAAIAVILNFMVIPLHDNSLVMLVNLVRAARGFAKKAGYRIWPSQIPICIHLSGKATRLSISQRWITCTEAEPREICVTETGGAREVLSC